MPIDDVAHGLLLLFTGGARAGELSPQAFTAAFAAAASAALPDAKDKAAGDLNLDTRSATGDTTATDLRNAYRVYLGDPAHLDAIIHRYVVLLVDTVHLSGVAPPLTALYRPVLKPVVGRLC